MALLRRALCPPSWACPETALDTCPAAYVRQGPHGLPPSSATAARGSARRACYGSHGDGPGSAHETQQPAQAVNDLQARVGRLWPSMCLAGFTLGVASSLGAGMAGHAIGCAYGRNLSFDFCLSPALDFFSCPTRTHTEPNLLAVGHGDMPPRHPRTRQGQTHSPRTQLTQLPQGP